MPSNADSMACLHEVRAEIIDQVRCDGSAHSPLTNTQLVAVARALGCDDGLGALLDNGELRVRIRCAVGVADSESDAKRRELMKDELVAIRDAVVMVETA